VSIFSYLSYRNINLFLPMFFPFHYFSTLCKSVSQRDIKILTPRPQPLFSLLPPPSEISKYNVIFFAKKPLFFSNLCYFLCCYRFDIS
jgi:hypothetical protein